MTTAIARAEPVTLAQLSAENAGLVHLKQQMRKGTDYGTIPGCGDKPTLFKPGAEKVLRYTGVSVTAIDIDDAAAAGSIRYRVSVTGTTPDGVVRGIGIGECSSAEEKYAWRRCVSDAEWGDTRDDRRRKKHTRDRSFKQIATNPADLANTVLKMAKKRAIVDLALTACAASEFFTQDLEDLPAEYRSQSSVDARRAETPSDVRSEPQQPQRAQPTQSAQTANGAAPARPEGRSAFTLRKAAEFGAAKSQTVRGAEMAKAAGEVPADSSQWTDKHVDMVLAHTEQIMDADKEGAK